eukprot:1063992-Ditylum_brightwellii.AAC.3
MLKTLKDAGGDEKQASLKLYKALVSTSVDAFSSEIRAYKVAITIKDKQLDFTKIMTIAKAKYTSLKMCNLWLQSTTRSSSTKKQGINDIVALKAELKQKDKIIKSYKSATPSTTKQSHHLIHKEPKPVPKSNPDYNITAQVGKGKDFATRADFFPWKHTPPKDENVYCIKNGLY